LEPFLGELRAQFGAQFLANLEKLIDATPDGRKRVAEGRERMKALQAQLSKQNATAAGA